VTSPDNVVAVGPNPTFVTVEKQNPESVIVDPPDVVPDPGVIDVTCGFPHS
jgi:hypothetical protein